jgi:dTDP-4-amino-4,6-dideoxygalactose transaminase
MVMLTDPTGLYAEIANDVEYEVLQIMRRCQFVGGHFVDRFERSLANYLDAGFAIGVSSGTDAVMLACEALHIGKNDSVIMANNAALGAAFGITRAGAKPILVDINPYTYMMDYDQVENILVTTPKKKSIKAIFVSDLYGQMPNLEKFKLLARKHCIAIIEDASQSLSSTYEYQCVGHYSTIAVASLGPEASLSGPGQGGAIITSNVDVAKVIKAKISGNNHTLGGSYALDAIHAVYLYHSLQKMSDWDEKRRKVARYYNEVFSSNQRPTQQPNCFHTYHRYMFCCKNIEERDLLEKVMVESDIDYEIPKPLINQSPVYLKYHYITPVSYEMNDRLIALPCHPTIQGSQALEVVRAIQSTCFE